MRIHKNLNIGILLLSFFLFSSCAHFGKNKTQVKRELANTLLEISGHDQDIQILINYIKETIQKKHYLFNEKISKQINQAIDESFKLETMREQAIESMVRLMTVNTLEVVNAWYKNTDIGKKIHELEVYARSPQGEEDFRIYSLSIKNQLPDLDYYQFAKEVVVSTKTVESMGMAFKTINSLVKLGLNGMKPVSQQKRFEHIVLLDQTNTINWGRQSLPALIASTMFIYQQLTVQERKQFLNFLQGEAGRKYIISSYLSFEESLKSATLKVAQNLEELSNSQKSMQSGSDGHLTQKNP